jgi:hypothetical protein
MLALVWGWIAVSAAGLDPEGSRVHAEGPQLDFDFGRTLACRDITPVDFEVLHHDQKLIEFTLRVAVHLRSGHVGEIEELEIEISDCDRRVRVHSMSPTTEMVSPYSGDIEVVKTVERSKTGSLSLGGELPAVVGDLVAHVTPSVSGGVASRETLTEKEHRVAPQQVRVASGTIHEEHGVLFKLRPTPQTTLEGTHELTVQLIVPSNWRADAMQVRCQATGRERFLWIKQHTVWSSKEARVALFLAGDAVARDAAERFVAR